MKYGDGRHLCYGFRGNGPPKIREYCGVLCSCCGGRNAVELPTEEDMDYTAEEGQVTDKRRFAHYLEKDPEF